MKLLHSLIFFTTNPIGVWLLGIPIVLSVSAAWAAYAIERPRQLYFIIKPNNMPTRGTEDQIYKELLQARVQMVRKDIESDWADMGLRVIPIGLFWPLLLLPAIAVVIFTELGQKRAEAVAITKRDEQFADMTKAEAVKIIEDRRLADELRRIAENRGIDVSKALANADVRTPSILDK